MMRMGDGTFRAAPPARRAAGGVSTLLAVGLALAASPAVSQGPMGPGGGAMTPQPRVAPAAPQAPVVTPQAPVVTPQMPMTVAPNPAVTPTGPTGGAQKTIRVINNSETDTAKTTTTPTGPANPTPNKFVNIDSSNRDHIDQDALRKPGGSTGPANPVANNSNNPIPSVNVMVRKQSGAGPISTAKTDGSGQTTFRQLEPGTYDVALPSVRGGTVSMTTFVNGTPVARTDFPAGSEIGTFTVAKASDTVILKFQTNLGKNPVDGIGGTGGGRFETTTTNGIGGTGGGRYTFK